LAALLLAALAGCSSERSGSPPTPDSLTRKYTALVHNYYDQYVAARGAAYEYCVVQVDPPKCRERGVAMIAVHEKFLKDLDTTPAPPKFAANDRVIRSQLPNGIADLKAMIAAADQGDKSAVFDAATEYIHDMRPTVIDVLHDIDPRWGD
jgi:hypothetical protein